MMPQASHHRKRAAMQVSKGGWRSPAGLGQSQRGSYSQRGTAPLNRPLRYRYARLWHIEFLPLCRAAARRGSGALAVAQAALFMPLATVVAYFTDRRLQMPLVRPPRSIG